MTDSDSPAVFMPPPAPAQNMPRQIRQTVNWAHVDETGAIICFGTSQGTDVFLQELAPGLIAVARPDHVTGFDPWRYINGEWVQTD